MFFFKQKTAYEMRISDWSSDVCSSDLFPRIAFELLHAEADALGVAVDADDLHLDRVTDVDDFARVVDALVAHVGDMEQAVDAAEVDERTISVMFLTAPSMIWPSSRFWIRPERCSARVSSRMARRDTTMLPRRDRKSTRLNSSH